MSSRRTRTEKDSAARSEGPARSARRWRKTRSPRSAAPLSRPSHTGCPENSWLPPGLHVIRTAGDQLVEENQDSQRHHENDPSFSFVKKTFGRVRFHLRQYSGYGDAAAVRHNGNRNGGEEQHHANPCLLLEKVSV